jgi:NAD(P)-dependent dehydrogenase (short-subunit alcohol dehydrogenase family)
MELGMEGKTAVITGADSGIGLETAKILMSEGVNLVLSDLKEAGLENALSELNKGNEKNAKIAGITADITSNVQVMDLARKVREDFGGAHILVHSAGARGAADDFLKLTDEDWMKTIEVDLMGAVRVARAFIPQMQELNWGRLILVSSENAFQPYIEESPYNACKAAIINLAKCLSRAYSRENVLINCISPAFIETPMTDTMMDEIATEKNISVGEAEEWFARNKRPHIAMKRRGQPDEVASVIAFMCSERASFVNGSNYRIDGGSVESAFG